MKVKTRLYKDPCEVSTKILIKEGAFPIAGKIETLEARMNRLIEIVGVLIDRSELSDQEILEITNCVDKYELINEVPK